MSSSYLARVTWEYVCKYREELREGGTGGDKSGRLPLTDQYGSDQRLLDKLQAGDDLWLFTAPVFGQGARRRTLPPSVLGHISITHKWNADTSRIEPAPAAQRVAAPVRNVRRLDLTREFRYWCAGIPSDALPIHNAFALIKSLTFDGRVTRLNPTCKGCNKADVPGRGPFGHLMQHFESIRKLTDDSAARLARLHDHVTARRTVFLSHRHEEAGPVVRAVAERLRDDALCWWDIEVLPQLRHYPDDVLQDMLDDGVRQSGWFVAFLTPGYAATPWTEGEYLAALKLCVMLPRGPTIIPVMLGGKLRNGMGKGLAIDYGEDAGKIADSLRERIVRGV